LSRDFVDQLTTLWKGTDYEARELYGELTTLTEGAWFTGFREHLHVAEIQYDVMRPVVIGVDCGTARTTAAVIVQTETIGPHRIKFKILADYLQRDLFSGENAQAILKLFCELGYGGRIHCVWLDPYGANQTTSLGPVARNEYAKVFGERFVHLAPGGPGSVCDGLDQLGGLLARQDIVVDPRCKHMIAAFKNFARESRGDTFLDIPKLHQSPYSDSIDALRYLVRGVWPEGRVEPPHFDMIHPSRLF
jgi:hypothetical protein